MYSVVCCKCGKQYTMLKALGKSIKHTFCSETCWKNFQNESCKGNS